MRGPIIGLVSGVVFGAGLALAQMTNPAKVLAFLDLTGAWDPSLAFVMGGGLAVMAIAWRLPRAPVLPMPSGIDARLVGGAALFGLGWGLAGLCPAPAIAGLSTGSLEIAIFVASMVVGLALFHFTLGAARARHDDTAATGEDGPMTRNDRIKTGVGATLVLLLTVACGSEPTTTGEAKLLSANALLSDPPAHALILDVRTPEEYAKGHVPGALNIPHTEVEARLSELAGDKDRPVVVYCERGKRAGMAEATLAAAGYTDLYHLEGDMQAWRDAGRPTATP